MRQKTDSSTAAPIHDLVKVYEKYCDFTTELAKDCGRDEAPLGYAEFAERFDALDLESRAFYAKFFCSDYRRSAEEGRRRVAAVIREFQDL